MAAQIRDLEARLQESEETLGAIRRGEIDALVVANPMRDHAVYTLEGADRPYRVLIEQIQEGALTLDEEGAILYSNHRLSAMLRSDPGSLVGRALPTILMADDRAGFRSFLAAACRGGARREFTLIAADQAWVPVYLSLSPLPSEDGSILLCGVVTDLTEHKLHIRELAEANARLKEQILERGKIEDALRQSQKMEAVGQLTGGLAHDFNNLLTGITAGLELLQTRVAQGRLQGIDRYIGVAQDAARRAASLTHRLLAFSRRQTLAPRVTDLADLARGMHELIQRTVGPEITLRSAATGHDPLHVLVDPGQMENALLNLCINARDAMPDGGEIRIEMGRQEIEADHARELSLEPGAYVELRVTDTGTGMTPDVLSRAFDPFFTTKPIGVGTGLGLSMIYGFVQQSGGQVRIASTIGQGTCVSLYLPVHAGSLLQAAVTPEQRDVPRAGGSESVLIVDDEATVRMLVAEVLKDLGYKALEAAEGATALALLRSDLRIDLLITDVGLPGGLNGRLLAEEARVVRPQLKVLFITGYAEDSVLSPSDLEPGMYIQTKPFGMEILARRIRQLIDET
ncbi:MAG TPA: ATP-binding protein [Acidisoma sp.]|nr:ATP-binding protein [Acidisoma sp.]